MKIVWSEHALSQIREIFEYISRDRPSAAESLLQAFLARVEGGDGFNVPRSTSTAVYDRHVVFVKPSYL